MDVSNQANNGLEWPPSALSYFSLCLFDSNPAHPMQTQTAGFSTPQTTALAVVCSGRNDRVGEMDSGGRLSMFSVTNVAEIPTSILEWVKASSISTGKATCIHRCQLSPGAVARTGSRRDLFLTKIKVRGCNDAGHLKAPLLAKYARNGAPLSFVMEK